MNPAEAFAQAPSVGTKTRKGPIGACEVYGPGDVKLFQILHERRHAGESWKEVQQVLDGVLGIAKPIDKDKFRYHWNGNCAHWDGIELP